MGLFARHLFLACLAFMLAACASTETRHAIQSETSTAPFQGKKFTKLLAIGLIDDRATRIARESIFADEFSNKAVATRSSFDLIPDLRTLMDQEEVREVLAKGSIDGVLMIGILEKGEEFDYEAYEAQEAVLRALGNDAFFTRLESSMAYYESGKFVLDIGLWDAKTLGPVWSATTDSYSQEPEAEMVKSIADFVFGALAQRGFIEAGGAR